jgi:hypothetical protein
MKTVRWKPLLIAIDVGQLQRLTLKLEANDIRHAIGAHLPWKAVATEPWLMVPATDLSRALALSANSNSYRAQLPVPSSLATQRLERY